MRPDIALAQVAEILEAVPGHPRARLIEGRALHAWGELDLAYEVLSSLAAGAAALGGDRPGARARRDGRTRRRGAFALACFRRATRLKPDLAPAWSALATALRETEPASDEADRADLAAIRAATKDPLLIEAAVALGEGRLEVAEPLLRNRLKMLPTDVSRDADAGRTGLAARPRRRRLDPTAPDR